MDIETKKSFNKFKHYLDLFNNAYFDKGHVLILYENNDRPKPKLYFIEKRSILDLVWI